MKRAAIHSISINRHEIHRHVQVTVRTFASARGTISDVVICTHPIAIACVDLVSTKDLFILHMELVIANGSMSCVLRKEGRKALALN